MKFIAIAAITALTIAGCKAKTDAGIVYDSTSSSQNVQTPPAEPTPDPAPTLPAMTPGKHGDTTVTASGLGIIDTKVGKGASPKKGQTITVNYTGTLPDGTVFDSNVNPQMGHVEPFSTKIGVGTVIPGWDEGMMSMKVGGKRRLIVPSQLGYGSQGMPPKIPGNATLVFDVELLSVN